MIDRKKQLNVSLIYDEEMNILPAVQINNKCGQIDLTTDMHYHIHFYKVFETSSDEHILNIWVYLSTEKKVGSHWLCPSTLASAVYIKRECDLMLEVQHIPRLVFG